VTVLADIVYDPSNSLDLDIKTKCADKNSGSPGSPGQSMVEFTYGAGTVIYLVEHIDEQIGNELGQTNFLINLINAKMRKVSNIRISSSESDIVEWESRGSLDNMRVASLNQKKINSYILKCSSSECLIPINITATNGTLILSNLNVTYRMPIYNVTAVVFGKPVFSSENLSMRNSPKRINATLKDAVSEELSKCSEEPCKLNISVFTHTPGKIILSRLDIGYRKCLVKEEVLAQAVACWERSGFGKSDSDLKCYELSIPPSCGSIDPVNESTVTELMLKEGDLCEILGNNDADPKCGKYDGIEWNAVSISSGKNILIEYSEKKGKIIIS
jgi:hypothetical protein